MSLVHALQGILCRTLLRTSHTLDNMYPGNVFFSSSPSLSLSLSLVFPWVSAMHACETTEERAREQNPHYLCKGRWSEGCNVSLRFSPSLFLGRTREDLRQRTLDLSLSPLDKHMEMETLWRCQMRGRGWDREKETLKYCIDALYVKHAPLRDEDACVVFCSIREKLVLLTDKCSRQHKIPMIIDSWFWYPFTSHNANYAFY